MSDSTEALPVPRWLRKDLVGQLAPAAIIDGAGWSTEGHDGAITVEDCIDKVPNRFELVLLAAHRARALSKGAAITVEPEKDKNSVVALREIAERTLPAGDAREQLIASIQTQIDIDEPDEVAAPAAPAALRPTLGRGDRSLDRSIDSLTEDELLRGLQQQVPEEPSLQARGQ